MKKISIFILFLLSFTNNLLSQFITDIAFNNTVTFYANSYANFEKARLARKKLKQIDIHVKAIQDSMVRIFKMNKEILNFDNKNLSNYFYLDDCKLYTFSSKGIKKLHKYLKKSNINLVDFDENNYVIIQFKHNMDVLLFKYPKDDWELQIFRKTVDISREYNNKSPFESLKLYDFLNSQIGKNCASMCEGYNRDALIKDITGINTYQKIQIAEYFNLIHRGIQLDMNFLQIKHNSDNGAFDLNQFAIQCNFRISHLNQLIDGFKVNNINVKWPSSNPSDIENLIFNQSRNYLSYFGEKTDNIPNGFGALYNTFGDTLFLGEWSNGIPKSGLLSNVWRRGNYKSYYIYKNGDMYLGSVDENGKRHGKGTYIFKDFQNGGSYSCDWIHDQCNYKTDLNKFKPIIIVSGNIKITYSANMEFCIDNTDGNFYCVFNNNGNFFSGVKSMTSNSNTDLSNYTYKGYTNSIFTGSKQWWDQSYDIKYGTHILDSRDNRFYLNGKNCIMNVGPRIYNGTFSYGGFQNGAIVYQEKIGSKSYMSFPIMGITTNNWRFTGSVDKNPNGLPKMYNGTFTYVDSSGISINRVIKNGLLVEISNNSVEATTESRSSIVDSDRIQSQFEINDNNNNESHKLLFVDFFALPKIYKPCVKTVSSAYITCPHCKNWTYEFRESNRCSYCGNSRRYFTGKSQSKVCSECNGTGRIIDSRATAVRNGEYLNNLASTNDAGVIIVITHKSANEIVWKYCNGKSYSFMPSLDFYQVVEREIIDIHGYKKIVKIAEINEFEGTKNSLHRTLFRQDYYKIAEYFNAHIADEVEFTNYFLNANGGEMVTFREYPLLFCSNYATKAPYLYFDNVAGIRYEIRNKGVLGACTFDKYDGRKYKDIKNLRYVLIVKNP
jgi:hypothetical protein